MSIIGAISREIRLSAAQQSLADFLEVDEDLLSAAGLVDPPEPKHRHKRTLHPVQLIFLG
jgi:hypothetical protein